MPSRRSPNGSSSTADRFPNGIPAADSPEVVEDPYPFYRHLLEHAPVHLDEASGNWCITRFDDVSEAAKRWDLLSSQTAEDHHDHLASMDPPRHDVHRKAAGRLFSPRRVAALEPMIRDICRDLMERIEDPTNFDISADLSSHLPSEVITSVLGMPDEEREAFKERALAVATATLGGDLHGAMVALQDLTWDVVTGDLPPHEGGVLASLLATVDEDDPDTLSLKEVVGLATNLVLAGTDTATNLISTAVVELDRRPDMLAEVTADRSLLEPLIEEVLRYESPVQWLGRRALQPYELHGVTIPEGAMVRLYWGAANRDPREFENPDELDLHRPPGRHLAFGYGLHFCLGAALARLETKVALDELIESGFPIVVHEEVERLRASIFRGYERVPVVRT